MGPPAFLHPITLRQSDLHGLRDVRHQGIPPPLPRLIVGRIPAEPAPAPIRGRSAKIQHRHNRHGLKNRNKTSQISYAPYVIRRNP